MWHRFISNIITKIDGHWVLSICHYFPNLQFRILCEIITNWSNKNENDHLWNKVIFVLWRTLWNSLPVDIKSAVTLGKFKTLVKSWQGPSCHCSICQLIIWIWTFTVVVLIFFTVLMLIFSILSISRGYLTSKIRNPPTIHPWGRGMGCLLRVYHLIMVDFLSSVSCSMSCYTWPRYIESVQF